MALWEKTGRVLLAGDHIVGVGSAVLDAECVLPVRCFICMRCLTRALTSTSSGGDMRTYLETTRRFLDLQPALAVPAHGPLSYDPVPLLQSYIAHRQAREDQILTAIAVPPQSDSDGEPSSDRQLYVSLSLAGGSANGRRGRAGGVQGRVTSAVAARQEERASSSAQAL